MACTLRVIDIPWKPSLQGRKVVCTSELQYQRSDESQGSFCEVISLLAMC